MDIGIYSRFFSALANEARVKLLELLQERDMSVSEIVDEMNMDQSVISYHLKCLANCGFVSRKVDGNRRIYSLRGEVVNDLLSTVGKHIERHKKGIYTCEVLDSE